MPPNALKLAAQLGLGVLVALLIAALLLTRETLADCKAARVADRAALAASNTSVDTLTASLAKVTADQRKLAADDAGRLAASTEALEMARAADRWRTAAIDRLQTSAAAIERPVASAGDVQLCEASEAVKAVWQ